MTIRIAACQVPAIREDMEAALRWVEKFATLADTTGIALVCFPECFLQGYLTDSETARQNAVDLASPAFEAILIRLAPYQPVIVLGLIEVEGDDLFNTAVIIRSGKLIGKYRKMHLLPGEQLFKTGSGYPVFELNSLKFGINICYDTQFPEAAARLAEQGARFILCPSNNMMRSQTAEKYKDLHHKLRIPRAVENKIWLISSDVTGQGEGRVAYGPTSVINPDGKVISQVPLMQTGMVVAELNDCLANHRI